MKFNFYSDGNHILSYLTNQISDMPYALFPYNEGWRQVVPNQATHRLYASEKYFFIRKHDHLLVFFIYDPTINLKNSGRLSEKILLRFIRKRGIQFDQFQFIFICDKRYLNKMNYVLAFNSYKNALLVYDYGKFYFETGHFREKTLTLRLDKKPSVAPFFYPSNGIFFFGPANEQAMQNLSLGIMQTCIHRHFSGDGRITIETLLEELNIADGYRYPYKKAVWFIIDKMSDCLPGDTPFKWNDATGELHGLYLSPLFANQKLTRQFVSACASRSFFGQLRVYQAELEEVATA